MRAVLLINPRSGRGRAPRNGHSIACALKDRGHEAQIFTFGQASPLDATDLGGADALIVVGGDGSVHHASRAAIEAGVPVYHAPSGNENLFAREFSMRPDPKSVLNALEHGPTERVDLARCNGLSFLLMCSVGPDASVIRRLNRARRRPTGHMAYMRPVLGETLRPYTPRMRVLVDGRPLVDSRRGMVIIANCRQYALRADPCPHASMTDTLLDVVFLPCATAVGALRRLVQCRMRRQERSRAILTARGSTVRVEIEGSDPICQMDGEAPTPGSAPDSARVLECTVEAGVLPVLLPPG